MFVTIQTLDDQVNATLNMFCSSKTKFTHGYSKLVLSPNHLQAAQIQRHTEVEEKQIIAQWLKQHTMQGVKQFLQACRDLVKEKVKC